MNLEIIRTFCLSKKGVSEEFPFDEDTLVFKVMGKIFCLTSLDNPVSVNLKCDPEKAVILREEHEEIQPGYHMNKVHWNTVSIIGALPDKFILDLVEHSYNLVVKGLSKTLKNELELL